MSGHRPKKFSVMLFAWVLGCAPLASVFAQANRQAQPNQAQNQQLTPAQQQAVLQWQAKQRAAAQQQAAAANNRVAARQQPFAQNQQQQAAPKAPFPPLNAQQQQRLDAILVQWQKKTQGTETLSCDFTRWHFDQFAAPAGVHASKSIGIIKYAAPDKGLFRVEEKQFYTGMKNQVPQFAPQPGKFGEWWVCTGKELLEYDQTEKKVTIQELPPHLRGTAIFNSPLPFVFNLDAEKIKEKFWISEGEAPDENTILINAWPKTQENRAQYKLVQIALGTDFLPKALVMYAPNFNIKTSPVWDQYEFSNVKRNAITSGFQQFLNFFIPQKPPAGWKVEKDNLLVGPPKVAGNQQPAAQR